MKRNSPYNTFSMYKIPLLLLAILVFSSVQKPVDTFKPVAVIELFTSEGCSSCPPADKLLAKTVSSGNKSVFALSFHVDYWNRLGWKDSFSTAQFSERQNMYVSAMHINGAYTPQMIVNGATEFVGSDALLLNAALTKSLNTKSEAGFTNLSLLNTGKSLTVNYSLDGDYNNSQIHFALITLHTFTAVKSGENGGHILEHTNVVRQFLSSAAASSGHIIFDNISGYNASNTAVVAYVQKRNNLQIVTAAMAKLVAP